MTISPKRSKHPVILLSRRCHQIFVLLTITAAGMAALLALLPAAGHDQIWFLLMAKRWSGGAELYGPEIFDANLPGIVWLSAVAVELGKLLHFEATAAGKLLVVLAEVGSLCLSLVFLRKLRGHEEPWQRWALFFAAIVLFAVVPARDFGQRDHLVAFLILPYVLGAAVPSSSELLTWLRVLGGVLAGAAICLKPHYVLVLVAVEVSLLIWPVNRTEAGARVRQLCRPEPWVAAAVCVVFLAAVRQFAPLYFAQALPISRQVYWAIGHLSVVELAWQGIELLALGVATVALFVRSQSRRNVHRLLLIAAIAATAAYFVQGTGWYYQQLPAISLFGALLMLLLLDAAPFATRGVPRWAVPCTTALCLLSLALTTHFMGYPFTRDRAFAIDSPDPAIFSALAPGTPVAILTTSVDEAMMPVERYGLTWAQRTNNLWLKPALLRDEQPWRGIPPKRTLPRLQIQELDALQHRWMVEDLKRWQPELVLIERCQAPEVKCQILEDRHDDLLEWFMPDPEFRAIWRNYRYTGPHGRFDVYTLKH